MKCSGQDHIPDQYFTCDKQEQDSCCDIFSSTDSGSWHVGRAGYVRLTGSRVWVEMRNQTHSLHYGLRKMLCLTSCLLTTLHRLIAISAVNLFWYSPTLICFRWGVYDAVKSVVWLQYGFSPHLAVRWCG